MSRKRTSNVRSIFSRPKVIAKVLKDDGRFPNSHLPVLLYQKISAKDSLGPEYWKELFRQNDWRGSWRNGIYSYHHYHSTSHEVLGAFQGAARVQLGGDHGMTIDFRAGDALVIPAGVAHKNLSSTSDFGIVGAYPEGME